MHVHGKFAKHIENSFRPSCCHLHRPSDGTRQMVLLAAAAVLTIAYDNLKSHEREYLRRLFQVLQFRRLFKAFYDDALRDNEEQLATALQDDEGGHLDDYLIKALQYNKNGHLCQLLKAFCDDKEGRLRQWFEAVHSHRHMYLRQLFNSSGFSSYVGE